MKRRIFKEIKRHDGEQNITELSIPQGYLQIWENCKYANGRNSIVRFYVNEGDRRKGHGIALIEAAKRRFNNISGQCSNMGSVMLLHKSGFRPYFNKNASMEEIKREFDKSNSLLMIWRK